MYIICKWKRGRWLCESKTRIYDTLTTYTRGSTPLLLHHFPITNMIIDGDKLEDIVAHIKEPAYIIVATPSGITCASNDECNELLPEEKNSLFVGINTCLFYSLVPPIEEDEDSDMMSA